MYHQPDVLGDLEAGYVSEEAGEVKFDNRPYAIAAHEFLAARGWNAEVTPVPADTPFQAVAEVYGEAYREDWSVEATKEMGGLG